MSNRNKRPAPLPPLPPRLSNATKQCAERLSKPSQVPLPKAVDHSIEYVTALAQHVTRTFNQVTVDAALIMQNDAEKVLIHALRECGCDTPKATARDIALVGYDLHIVPQWYVNRSIARDLVEKYSNALSWGHLAKLAMLVGPAPRLRPDPPTVNKDDFYAHPEIDSEALSPIDMQDRRRVWGLAMDACMELAYRVEAESLTVTQVEREVSKALGLKPRGRPSGERSSVKRKFSIPSIPV